MRIINTYIQHTKDARIVNTFYGFFIQIFDKFINEK